MMPGGPQPTSHPISAEGVRSPRVVDFSTHLSGPLASRHMIQMGADVVKVESPKAGDGNRGTPPFVDGVGLYHLAVNGGARSLVADRHSDHWPEIVAALARWADVVIVGNRPATATRLGIDFPSLARHSPKIVYCLISGYGLEGPWAARPAHGLNIDAHAGAVPVEWEEGRPAAPADYRSAGTTLAAIEASLGIYAALHRRDLTGVAQFVHVSIWEAALSWRWRDLAAHLTLHGPWPDYRDKGSRYCMYRTSDGRAVLVCPVEQHFWRRFVAALGLPPDLADRGDWSRGGMDFGADYVALGEREVIQERMAARTAGEWAEVFDDHDIPFAPVLDWRDVVGTEHAAANGVVADYAYGDRRVALTTVPVSVTPVRHPHATSLQDLAAAHRTKGVAVAPPELGADTGRVLEDIGLAHLKEALQVTDT